MQKEKTILLVVKGNKFEAAKKATSLGIPFVFQRERGNYETLGKCGFEHHEKIQNWFIENSQTPYPVGTLLFYSSK